MSGTKTAIAGEEYFSHGCGILKLRRGHSEFQEKNKNPKLFTTSFFFSPFCGYTSISIKPIM